MDKAIITCALNGVLTNPKQHPVPVTPNECAASAREAYDAGASIIHVHYRDQRPDMGHLPTWNPTVAQEITEAIRSACPGVLINSTTGVVGPDYQGPLDVIRTLKPEIAACNAGTLNYLKVKANGDWAWPPMVFDNPPDKVQDFLDVMAETGTLPEMECFDTGIVRSVAMYIANGMMERAQYNLVMGVASGMPVDSRLLEFLMDHITPGSLWQATLIGRAEIWETHQKAAELGGMLRTGVEDTFYLPDGARASGNGALITALADCAQKAGRSVASPEEAREILGL